MVRRTAILFFASLVQSLDFRVVMAVRAIAPDLAVGVDGIITNDPGGLIVHLKAKWMR